jgi:D-beta-D-heptose 7-phosphate kinase/D-beta-D-heptose 1-phosphate adenosyltransferase
LNRKPVPANLPDTQIDIDECYSNFRAPIDKIPLVSKPQPGQWLRLDSPRLKLHFNMDGRNELIEIWDDIANRPRMLVIGDLMLDRYTSGAAQRISQEAPVLVLQAAEREHRLGGAASVCHMLAALGADVHCLGVVGNDSSAVTLLDLAARAGIRTDSILVDAGRCTTLKERFVGRSGSGLPGQILRVDSESTEPVSALVENEIIAILERTFPDIDAVLIPDYDKGVCTPRVLAETISQAKRRGIPVLVDPGRHRDFSLYRKATLLKPNRAETQAAVNQSIDSPEAAIRAGRMLCQRAEIDTVVVTLDSDGICLVRRDGPASIYRTAARSVYDITGAGDMVLSVLGFCMADGVSVEHAVQLANAAAGLEIDRPGVAVLSRLEIRRQLHALSGRPPAKQVSLEQASALADELRRQRKTIVLTNGCFDLLHVGHVAYLQESALMGDVLFVAINSDESVRRLKGPSRPIIGQADRVAMLSALECVDNVIVFDSDTPCDLIRALRPDVLVKGGTYTRDQVVGHEIVDEYGGQVRVAGAVDGVSTTQIVDSLQQRSEFKKAG